MEYHLYHHDDLDGIASGAIFLEFLKTRGDSYGSTHPVNYEIDMTSEHWTSFHFKKPFIIFDFQYHPDAHWWVDHHDSAFRLAGQVAQDNFNNDSQHHLDKDAPSGAGLLMRFLEDKHDFDSSDIIKDLVKFVDIDDSATYKTLQDSIDMVNPYKIIQLLLDDPMIEIGDDKYYEFRHELINTLGNTKIEDILDRPSLKIRIEDVKQARQKLNNDIQSHAKLDDKVVVLDATGIKDVPNKALGFVPFQNTPYLVIIYGIEGKYKVRCVWNNWSKTKPMLDMTKTAQRFNKGAGGHQGIGAFPVKTKQEALDALEQLTDYINERG